MSAMPIGVSMMPLENRHDTLIDVATTAERLGYDSYFLPETWAYDVTVLMAEAAFRRAGAGAPARRARSARRGDRCPTAQAQPGSEDGGSHLSGGAHRRVRATRRRAGGRLASVSLSAPLLAPRPGAPPRRCRAL